jgi:hypothetical protein
MKCAIVLAGVLLALAGCADQFTKDCGLGKILTGCDSQPTVIVPLYSVSTVTVPQAHVPVSPQP